MNGFFLLVLASIALATGSEVVGLMEPPGLVEGLLRRLKLEEWTPGEAACHQDMVALLQGVRNHTLWAMWAWNSVQLPVGTFYGSKFNFGNFDQCLQVPWASSHPDLRMQYCLVNVRLAELKKFSGELTDPYGSAEEFVRMESKQGKQYNTLFLGVCVPRTCKPNSVAKITRHIYQLSNLPFEDLNVDPLSCQVTEQKIEKTTGFYLFWCIIFAMTLLCILFNLMDSNKPDSIVSKLCHCFNLKRNFDSLTKIEENEIKVLHGIRALTSSMLIIIHLFFFMVAVALMNHQDAVKHLTSASSRLLMHLDLLVDTFFVLSGLLHTRSLILNDSSGPIKALFKRYFRLVAPVCLLSVLFFGHVLPHLGSGPIWPAFIRREYEACSKTSWRNLLLMGNDVGEKEYCIAVSWYIHCDYQLAILGTAIFMMFQWNKKGGFVTFCVTYILSLIIPAIQSYRLDLPPIFWHGFGDALDTATNKLFWTIYVFSYNRASTYLIGMGMGYLLTKYKPQDYRKTISKLWSVAGICLALCLMCLMLAAGSAALNWNRGVLTASLAALDRSGWAFAVCLVIVVCEYGTLPLISDFLGSKIMIPLSKLSYANYMGHTIFLFKSLFSLRAPISYNILDWITHGLGYVVISTMFSFIFWVIIEAPTMNFINLQFKNRSRKTNEMTNIKVAAKQTSQTKAKKIS